MASAIIISDFLEEVAEDVDAAERGIITTWEEFNNRKLNEDILILDLEISTTEDKTGGDTVGGESTHDAMVFLERSIIELLETGRTIVALTTSLESLHPRPNKTYLFSNYSWLSKFDGFPAESAPPPESDMECAVSEVVDHWWTEVNLARVEEPYTTYFANVTNSEVYIDAEKSAIHDYEVIARIPREHPDGDSPVGLVAKSWEYDGEVIEPDGNVVFLPKPDEIRVDGRQWFRSIIEIGQLFSPSSESIDQYNRLIGRAHTSQLEKVYRICDRLSSVARQLQERYGDRDTIEINDEYDVQDLFHALLKLYFDDIREEEWAPSYAGKSPRIDFLLKQETIAVEIKITRSGRGNDDILEELSEDKEHYRAHPDCEFLVCYVHDPGYEISNPAGFEEDLSEDTDKLTTEVIVSSTSRISGI